QDTPFFMLLYQRIMGTKNAGFDVLYHNMKHGQLATKELAEFVRERAAIEETYSKSMSKLAKMASNGSPLGTFAPMWDVFRVSSDKLALCHLELMRKMNSLIADVNKYGDEQVKVHRKTKEEVVGTLEAVQTLQVQSGQLQKCRETYSGRCAELERLRREGAPQKEMEKAELKSKKAAESLSSCVEKYNRVGSDFEQKMLESAQKFQDIEETHLRQMKQLIKAYSHSIEDTHVQVGQVHEEFKQNVENIGIENLIKKFAEQKGTGKERPAPVGFEDCSSSLVSDGGKRVRSKAFRIPGLGKRDKEPDSTYRALPVLAVYRRAGEDVANDSHTLCYHERHAREFRSVPECLVLLDCRWSPSSRCPQDKDASFFSSDSDFDDDEPKKFRIQIRPVGAGAGRRNPPADERELRATVGALTLPPNRAVRRGGGGVFHPDHNEWGLWELSFPPGLSRGPSPITLSTQESWPVAAAITEYINAYFKGGEHNRCLVKITGDLTMSFPAGITRIFTANPNAPVLSFRLVNTGRVDSFLPNQKLLYSDPSQSDPDTRDFWFNMQALTFHLQREAELNPQASYYNIGLLKYQLSSQDPGCAPLLLSAECQRSGTVTRVSLDYHCCPVTAPSAQLTNVQVLLPLDHTATDLQCQPPALWRCCQGDEAPFFLHVPSPTPGSGTLCASWQCLEVPRGPPPSLVVQFVGSGASLSGLDVELVGSRYRMSLVKKRFTTGKYMAGCSM
uniref:FCH and mu domain containing endocytic adaptor 1 n=1 Tax=Scleropages formosus TaxID=113540 RepID=A0A8C9S1L2_SCLFO